MEIPDWDTIEDLQKDIRKINEKLDKLIKYLKVPTNYIVENREFNNIEDAQKYVDILNENIREIRGYSGCAEVYSIQERPDFS